MIDTILQRDQLVWYRAEIVGVIGPVMLLARILDCKNTTVEIELLAAERRGFWVLREALHSPLLPNGYAPA